MCLSRSQIKVVLECPPKMIKAILVSSNYTPHTFNPYGDVTMLYLLWQMEEVGSISDHISNSTNYEVITRNWVGWVGLIKYVDHLTYHLAVCCKVMNT